MRLRRIEAVRFGRLSDVSLGELGDGLTIVEGPNEAGKSTFTALVRHVLYGFPTAREKERQYYSAAGKRQGRLLFEDAGKRWVIERTEGTHGGPVEVHALDGTPRPALRDEVTAGVSPLAFKVVFGFGLDEMAHIEGLRGSSDDIIARLYAASAGLAVSPHDVRASLEKDAEELFTARGKTKRANVLLGEIKHARGELRALSEEASAFSTDRARLTELDAELAEARSLRDERRAAYTEAARASERLGERISRVDTLEAELVELRAGLAAAIEAGERAVPDARVLAVRSELEALLEEASAHAQGRTDLRDAEAALAQARRRFEDAVARTGRDADAVGVIDASPEAIQTVDTARAELGRLEVEIETRTRESERATLAAQEASKFAASASATAGIAADAGPREVLAERLAALDSLESGVPASTGGRRLDAPALVLLVSGVIAIAAGLSLKEYVAVVIGAVLVAAGGFFLLTRMRAAGHVQGAPADALEVLELGAEPTGMEIARTRRLLEAARSALTTEDDARRTESAAASEVELARSTFEARRKLWSRWLASNGLPEDMTTAEAAQTLTLVREAQAARIVADDARDAVDRLQGRLDTYARKLAGILSLFTEVAEHPTEDDVPLLVGKAREALGRLNAQLGERDELERKAAELQSRVSVAEQKTVQARDEATAILQKWGTADGDSLEAIAEGHRIAFEEAERSVETLADDRSRLDERLAERVREARGGELRLQLTGLTERLQETADEYLATQVAARLVAATQERYERERQPEVVRRAQDAFRSITDDRYVGLTVPIAGGSVEVFDERSDVKTSDELSRGTAEAMYLALRLGLIGQLDDVGRGLPVLMDDVLVNFDPARRRGSTEAIAALASQRQIVLFTCHPETARLFSEVCPDATHIALDRC